MLKYFFNFLTGVQNAKPASYYKNHSFAIFRKTFRIEEYQILSSYLLAQLDFIRRNLPISTDTPSFHRNLTRLPPKLFCYGN